MAHAPEATPHTVTGRFRRPPAPWLWLALLLVPLLAALLTWVTRPHDPSTPTSAASTPAATPTAAADAGQVSVVGDTRHRLFVTSVVPDEHTRTTLLQAVRSVSDGHPVTNRVTVSAGQAVTDFTGLPTVVKEASTRLDDFGVLLTPGAVTIRGTTSAGDAGQALDAAARQAFPGRSVRVDLTGATGSANPTTSAAATTPAAATPLTCTDIQTQIGARLKASPVTFESAAAKVDAASAQRLTDIGQALAKCQATQVQVQGHTDSTGSATINMPLSQRRAEAVRDTLVAAGLPAGSVTAKGYGAAQPVASGTDATAQAQNRRVVILVGKEGQ